MAKRNRAIVVTGELVFEVTNTGTRGTYFIPVDSGTSVPIVAGQTLVLTAREDLVNTLIGHKNLVIKVLKKG